MSAKIKLIIEPLIFVVSAIFNFHFFLPDLQYVTYQSSLSIIFINFYRILLSYYWTMVIILLKK